MYPPAGPIRASAEPTSADGRVIIHLDLDAFYAQVESRRLGIHASTPLVVQQWRGIIAVNYAARAAGIKRHLTVDEAAKLCPGVVFVHVETIGDDEDEEDDEHVAEDHGRDANDESKKNATGCLKTDFDDALRARRTYRPNDGTFARDDEPSRRAVVTNTNGGCLNEPPDRERRKVSLARYRRASVAVMETLADVFPDGAVERASVDEAYVDVTREVDAILRKGLDSNDVTSRLAAGLEASGHVRALRPEASVSDARLALGADACRRRAPPFSQRPGTRCPAGSRTTRCSPSWRPRGTSRTSRRSCLARRWTRCSRACRCARSKGWGVSSASASSARLSNVSPRKTARETRRATGPRPARRGPPQSAGRGRAPGGAPRTKGGSRRRRCGLCFQTKTRENETKRLRVGRQSVPRGSSRGASRGEDADPVVANVRDGAKSVTAFKSFKPVFDKARAHTWLKVLALELAERLAEDRRRFSRTPRTVRLEWRAEPNARAVPPRESFETRSKTFAFPADASAALGSGNTPRAGEALTHAATRVFDALGPEATSPCTRVGLAASDFAPVPGARGGGIERFFVSDEKPRDSSRRTEETETNETRKNASLASVGAVRRRDLKKCERGVDAAAGDAARLLNRRRRFRNRQKAPRRTKCVWPREPTRSWCVPAAACGPPRGATRSRTRTSTSRLTCRRASRSTGAPGRARARREGKHIRREAGAARSAPGERGRQARDAAGTASVSAFFAKR